MIRSNCEILFTVSLLVLMIASTSVVPSVAQQQRVGEIILDPTHAVPGTLVTFQGVGWYVMPYPSVGRYLLCMVNGVPVKMDRYAKCEVLLHEGIYEPAGTFVIADVPAGDYPIFIEVEPQDPHAPLLTAEIIFTVDPVATATSVAPTTVVTSVTPHTSTLATSVAPTVLTVTATVTTTKTESPSMPQALDYTTMLASLFVAAVCLVVILAAVVLRKKPKSA